MSESEAEYHLRSKKVKKIDYNVRNDNWELQMYPENRHLAV